MKVLVSTHLNNVISVSVFQQLSLIKCSDILKSLIDNLGRDLHDCFFRDEKLDSSLKIPGIYLVDIDVLYEKTLENCIPSELDYKIRISRIWKYNFTYDRSSANIGLDIG